MKVKIKSFNGSLPEYLTEGNMYKFQKIKEYCGLITVDNGLEYFTYIKGSCHLNGGDWEVVE